MFVHALTVDELARAFRSRVHAGGRPPPDSALDPGLVECRRRRVAQAVRGASQTSGRAVGPIWCSKKPATRSVAGLLPLPDGTALA